jgi:hypothetical protein
MNQFQMPGLSGYGNLKIHFTDYRVHQELGNRWKLLPVSGLARPRGRF